MTALTPVGETVPATPDQVLKHKLKFPKTIGPGFTNRILPYVETFWHEKKRYPSNADLINRFGFTQDNLNVLHSNKFYLQCLDRRGITRPDQTSLDGTPIGLDARQVAAITILTNFNDLRHPVARMAEIGVTEEELHGWYQNSLFTSQLARRAEDAFDNVAPTATVELAKAIKRGNFQAIKFYYEITGQAASPEALNLKQAMNVLIEAVQKHVKDPAILSAIAEEVQTVRGLKGL